MEKSELNEIIHHDFPDSYELGEILALYGLFKSSFFRKKMLKHIDLSFFHEDLLIFAKTIFKLNEENAEFATQNFKLYAKEILRQTYRGKEDRRKAAKLFLSNLAKFNHLKISVEDFLENNNWVIKKAYTFVKREMRRKVLIDGANKLHSENFADIDEALRTISALDFDDSDYLDYFNDIESHLIRITEEKILVSTGIECLDDLFNGGMPSKKLVVFQGPSNIGKTLILGQIAKNMVEAGKNIIYFTFELDIDEIGSRMDASIAKVTTSYIARSLEKVAKRIKEHKKDVRGRLIIKYFPADCKSSLDLRAFVDIMESMENFKVDAIIVDFLTLMVSAKSQRDDNDYKKYGRVAKELRNIGVEYDIPVISAGQANRSAYNYDVDDMHQGQIGDSLQIAQASDITISIIKNKELDKKNQILCEIIKSRVGRTGYQFIIEVDYDTLTFVGSHLVDSEIIKNFKKKKPEIGDVIGSKKKEEKQENEKKETVNKSNEDEDSTMIFGGIE